MLSGIKFAPREQVTSASQQTKRCKHGHKKAASKKRHHKHYSDDSSGGVEHMHREHKNGSHRHKKSGIYLSGSSDDNYETGFSDRETDASCKHRQRKGKRHRKQHHMGPSSGNDEDIKESHSQESDTSGGKKFSAGLARKEAGLEWMIMAPSRPATSVTDPVDISTSVSQEEKTHPNPKELNPFLKDGDGYPLENEKGDLKSVGGCSLHYHPVVGDGGVSWRLKALKRAKEQAEREGRKLDEVVEERWGNMASMIASVSTRRAAHANAHLHSIRDRKHHHTASMEGGNAQIRSIAADASDMASDHGENNQTIKIDSNDYLKSTSVQSSRMRVPRVDSPLPWRSNKANKLAALHPADADIVQAAASALNKFENDGSFLKKFKDKPIGQLHVSNNDVKQVIVECNETEATNSHFELAGTKHDLADHAKENPEMHDASGCTSQSLERTDRLQEFEVSKQQVAIGQLNTREYSSLSANQLAAKAMQLQMKGKQEEAASLLKQLEILKQERASATQNASKDMMENTDNRSLRNTAQVAGQMPRHRMTEHVSWKQRDDGDTSMAASILRNKNYNISTSVDDEYEFGPLMKTGDRRIKGSLMHKKEMEVNQAVHKHKHIITQQERCQFCFDNPSRPKHLTISIANSTYLMLPPRGALVQGHCYILPFQHDGSTRNVDENVWEELRNYKKCLLRMFASQERDVIFMETAMGMARQRRHCLVECIPLPHGMVKQAPLYFKKAIEEAEDEWSQHNAKKLIDTSTKGLRGCIPKNFPYFHVEFGLNAGYVHVIDDEKVFRSHFGQDVVIGMLKLTEERMNRRCQQGSQEHQREAVMEFQKMWDSFDWTKMLD
eukprot:c27741_g1_i2 orf=235-2757(+)